MICEQLRRGAGLRTKNRVHQPILVCVIELRPFAPAVPEQLGLQIVVPPNIIVHLLWDSVSVKTGKSIRPGAFSLVLPCSKAVPDEEAQQNGQCGRKIVKDTLEIQGRYGRGPTYKPGSDSKISS